MSAAELHWEPGRKGVSMEGGGKDDQKSFQHGGHSQGRGRGRRSKEMDDVMISKTLSSILRHNAGNYGLQLMTGGYLYVDELLKKVHKLNGVTEEDVKRVVNNNDKKRFTLEMEENKLKIRANQGHSLQVEDLELMPVSSADDCPVLIHGTYYSEWEKIKTTGLSRMGRNHIHFAVGEPGEEGVISGMRKTCEIMIYLDLEKALKAGLPFFRSANNVILSPGDADGVIAPCYFRGVVDRIKRHKVDFDDKIGAQTSADAAPEDDGGNKKKRKKNKKKKHAEEKDESESKTREFDENEDIKAEVQAASASKHAAASNPSRIEWKSECNFLSSVEDSTNFIDKVLANPSQFVVILCAGQKLGEKDSCIKYIVILARPEICVYHFTSESKDLMIGGHLDQLFLSKDIAKVFSHIGPVSLSLIQECDILLDGTPVWDIQLMLDKVQLGKLEQEEFQEKYGFGSLKAERKKWAKDDEDFAKKSASSQLDRTIVDSLVKRGKLIWDIYDHCQSKLTPPLTKSLKAEIFKAAFSSKDDQLIKKIQQLKMQRKEKNKNEKKQSKTN